MTVCFSLCLLLLTLCFNISAATDNTNANADHQEFTEETDKKSNTEDSAKEESNESSITEENPNKSDSESTDEQVPPQTTGELISVSSTIETKIDDPLDVIVRLEEEKEKRNLETLEKCVKATNETIDLLNALNIVAIKSSTNEKVYFAKGDQIENERQRDPYDYPTDINFEEARAINNCQTLAQ
ncbi:MAG: hypothetical protein LBP31_01360 [Holosporales bacterium]|jgi:hypothetical protein|nr:hypothetical protein [Holosporales bacterium]